ncbi:MAG: lytic transglycosylase [Mycobacterium sp.]|nr:lytic transglycosylase [Mycobacterium sp.]
MQIGGGARTAHEWVRCRLTRVAQAPRRLVEAGRSPRRLIEAGRNSRRLIEAGRNSLRLIEAGRNSKSGLIVLAPLVLAGAVAASPAPATLGFPTVQRTGVVPLAAVAPKPPDQNGPSVVSVARPATSFHIAEASIIAPPPPLAVVNSVGSLRIPAIALAAYRNAERMMVLAAPGCGVSWNLLAGIGRIESMHANGGATDARGTAVYPIYGPALDGSLPGNEVIVQGMAPNGRATYARAMGPMQFLPGTWSRYASDGDGDGKADPQNIFDAALAAARYLCTGGLNLRDQSQVLTAILRYNNSMPYAQNVLGWAAAYATGVVPVDLPPITGPIPPVGDEHMTGNPEGLGPGMPMNVLGLSPTDPLSQMPLITFGPTDAASQLNNPTPVLDPATLAALNPAQPPTCVLVCFGQNPLPPPAQLPPVGVPQGSGPLPGPAPSSSPTAQMPGALPAGPSAQAPPNPIAPPPNPFAPQPNPLAPPLNPFAPPPGPLAPPPAAPPAPASPSPSPAPSPALPPTHGPLPGPAG